MKIINLKCFYVFFLSFLLFSCSYNIHGPKDDNKQDGSNNNSQDEDIEDIFSGKYSEEDFLFEETEDDSVILNVIDESYWTSQGSTIWTILDDVPSVSEQDFEVTVSKLAGTSEAGYGIVFGVTESNYLKSMLIFLINVNGEYALGELKGTEFKYFQRWKKLDCINQGYNENNTLRVSYENKYRYSFYINDNHVQYLYSPSYHGHLEGKNGYIAVISPKDRLPDESVTVKYKLN